MTEEQRGSGEALVRPVVGIRELSRHTSRIVDEITATGRPKLVTHQGQAAAIIHPIDADFVLNELIDSAPWFAARRERGLAELKRGQSLTPDELAALRAQIRNATTKKISRSRATTRQSRKAGVTRTRKTATKQRTSAVSAKKRARKTSTKKQTSAVSAKKRARKPSTKKRGARKKAATRR